MNRIHSIINNMFTNYNEKHPEKLRFENDLYNIVKDKENIIKVALRKNTKNKTVMLEIVNYIKDSETVGKDNTIINHTITHYEYKFKNRRELHQYFKSFVLSIIVEIGMDTGDEKDEPGLYLRENKYIWLLSNNFNNVD